MKAPFRREGRRTHPAQPSGAGRKIPACLNSAEVWIKALQAGRAGEKAVQGEEPQGGGVRGYPANVKNSMTALHGKQGTETVGKDHYLPVSFTGSLRLRPCRQGQAERCH